MSTRTMESDLYLKKMFFLIGNLSDAPNSLSSSNRFIKQSSSPNVTLDNFVLRGFSVQPVVRGKSNQYICFVRNSGGM